MKQFSTLIRFPDPDLVVVAVCQCLDQQVSNILGVLEILDTVSSWTF